MAARLKQRGIAAIYTSPLRRTRETADALAAATGLPITEDPRLREVEIAGVGSGCDARLSGDCDRATAAGRIFPEPKSSHDVRARMHEALGAIVAAHPGTRIAAVSHAGAINAYIASLLGLTSDFFFPAGNTSISIVRARDDRRLLVTVNDIAHLEALK